MSCAAGRKFFTAGFVPRCPGTEGRGRISRELKAKNTIQSIEMLEIRWLKNANGKATLWRASLLGPPYAPGKLLPDLGIHLCFTQRLPTLPCADQQFFAGPAVTLGKKSLYNVCNRI